MRKKRWTRFGPAVLLLCVAVRFEAFAATSVFRAGEVDNFALPADPVSPSAELVALLPTAPQAYDLIAGVNGGAPDRQVAHTFSQLPLGIVAATLEMRVRAGSVAGVNSDGIIVSFADGTQANYAEAVAWARPFGPWPGGGIFGPNPDPGLLKATSWSVGDDVTFTLDLSALPVNGGGSLDLITELNVRGFLDVNVSDETGVDYAILTVDTGPVAVPELTTLTIDHAVGGEMTLAWGVSCTTPDGDYEVYEGTIGSYYSHAAVLCSTGGLTTATLTPSPGNRYYLVVPRNLFAEGSYGASSGGPERPPGGAACLPQAMNTVCP